MIINVQVNNTGKPIYRPSQIHHLASIMDNIVFVVESRLNVGLPLGDTKIKSKQI